MSPFFGKTKVFFAKSWPELKMPDLKLLGFRGKSSTGPAARQASSDAIKTAFGEISATSWDL